MKKIISIIANGIMSGIFLCAGCTVNIMSDSKVLGAFLFSIGLFAIIRFGFALYTGKAGYMAMKPPSYIGEVAVTLVGNGIGAVMGGTLLNLTKLGPILSEKAAAIVDAKFADSPLSIFVLAIFCGIMMFTAVEGNRRSMEKNDTVGALFVVVLPVMVFILCGFNHCVADLSYFCISRFAHAVGAPMYFLCAIFGNALGCMTIPLIKKLASEKL